MLTEEQMLVVNADEDRVKVMAGAGSGKTTVLVHRILHLIDKGVSPSAILPITFTRKAARELKSRLHGYARYMQVGTFHSICLTALRRNGRHYNVLDEEQALQVMDDCAVSLGMAVKLNSGVTYTKKTRSHWAKHIEACRHSECTSASPIADTYLTRLAMNGDIDYSGILHEGLAMAKDANGPFARIEHVIVDEAQDTSQLQWDIVYALGERASLMAVGDTAQNLFSFAGAAPEIFENLKWKRFELTESFRNPRNIVDLTNTFPIERVTLRSNKDPIPHHAMKTDDVGALSQWLVGQGMEYKDIAVLCRYNSQADHYEQQLLESALPVVRNKVEKRGPVFRLLSYIANPHSPTARESAKMAWAGSPVTEAPMRWIDSAMQTGSVAEMVGSWTSKLGVRWGVEEVLGAIEVPIFFQHEADHYSKKYSGDTIDHFILEESLVEPLTDDSTPGITLSTIHGAKGGEWPVIIIPGLEEESWPSSSTPKPEEWRVFYVGITRTIQSLYLLYDGEPGVFAQKGME